MEGFHPYSSSRNSACLMYLSSVNRPCRLVATVLFVNWLTITVRCWDPACTDVPFYSTYTTDSVVRSSLVFLQPTVYRQRRPPITHGMSKAFHLFLARPLFHQATLLSKYTTPIVKDTRSIIAETGDHQILFHTGHFHLQHLC
jgi:hypothetical protein